jgi:hypothetical protein
MPNRLLDWDQYYENFFDAHGGDPIKIGVDLLFRDGWRYNLNIEGSETPPPKDVAEQLALKRCYWTFRINILSQEARERIAELKKFITIQEGHCCVLQQTEMTTEGGVIILKGQSTDLPLRRLASEVEALLNDIDAAKQALQSVAYEPPPEPMDLRDVKEHLIHLESRL